MPSSVEQSLWGRELVVCMSGFEKSERHHIEQIVTSAGGEYSTGLSRRCTVFLVPTSISPSIDLPCSRKLQLFFRNRHKHKAKLLVKDWLLDCSRRGCLVPTTAYEVPTQVCKISLPQVLPLTSQVPTVLTKAPWMAAVLPRIRPWNCSQALASMQLPFRDLALLCLCTQ